MAFCMFVQVDLSNVSVSTLLSYLEFLVENAVFADMINNHILVIRAMSIGYDLPYASWEHPKVKYFVKALKLHRPLVLPKNVIDINTLRRMVALCQQFMDASVYKAVWLTAFFDFFHLLNIAEFDCTKHFTGGDVFF